MGSSTTSRLDVARHYAEEVIRQLEPWTQRAVIAGSIRRNHPDPKDIEIVAKPSIVKDGFFEDARLTVQEIQQVARSLAGRDRTPSKMGERFIQVPRVLDSPFTLDLFLVHPPAEWGVILAIRTGPAGFSQHLVTRIKGRLWRCQDGWVRDNQGRRVPCSTEEAFFEAAQVPFLPPEERKFTSWLHDSP